MNYFARVRRSLGAWHQGMLIDQSEKTGTSLEELQEFDHAVQADGGVIVAVDSPPPARAYGSLVVQQYGGEATALARVHALEQAPDDVYRALFSTLAVQAARLAEEGGVTISLDTATAADYVVDAVERLGGPYGLTAMRRTEDIEADEATPVAATQGDEDREGAELAPDGSAPVPEETLAGTPVEAGTEPASEVEAEPTPETGDDRPHKCEECGRGFKTPQALSSHARSH